MKPITAEELDLLTFFEAEPKRLDPDVAWPYNDFLYEVASEELALSFALHPAYKDVRIIFMKGKLVLYEMNALGVDDLKYHNDNGRESLAIVINEQDTLWLRLKPTISLTHEIRERT